MRIRKGFLFSVRLVWNVLLTGAVVSFHCAALPAKLKVVNETKGKFEWFIHWKISSWCACVAVAPSFRELFYEWWIRQQFHSSLDLTLNRKLKIIVIAVENSAATVKGRKAIRAGTYRDNSIRQNVLLAERCSGSCCKSCEKKKSSEKWKVAISRYLEYSCRIDSLCNVFGL